MAGQLCAPEPYFDAQLKSYPKRMRGSNSSTNGTTIMMILRPEKSNGKGQQPVVTRAQILGDILASTEQTSIHINFPLDDRS